MFFLTLIFFCMVTAHDCSGRKLRGLDPFAVCDWDITKEYVPLNDTELIQFCERLMEYYDCVDELSNVLRPEEFYDMALVLREAKPVLQELCTVGGRLFTRYKLYGNCFKYVPFYYKESYNSGKKLAEIYVKTATNEQKARKLKKCFAGTQFLHALMMRIKILCDEEAAELYDELHHRTYIYLLYCRDTEEYTAAKAAAASATIHALIQGAVHNPQFPGVVPTMLDEKYIRKSKRTEF